MTDDSPRGSPLKKVVAASMIGATIEWYDFFPYGLAASLVFNRLFFPEADPLSGVMLAFGTYALGFVARPIGGAVFGHYGDRIGRKTLLMLSLGLMGVATFLIGLLPTYAQIGVWAPILLIVLRIVQGFAVGGEWGGAILLVAEYADAPRRGFWASWPQVGVPFGNLLATLMLAVLSATLSDEAFFEWGWRIPFLLSAILIGIGYWVRVSVEESPVFAEARKAHGGAVDSPVLDVIRKRPKGLLIGAGLRVGENISFYVITTFSLVYITTVANLPRQLGLDAIIAGGVAQCVAIPLFARLSDRIGRRPVYAFGAMGLAAWAFAFFPLLSSGQTVNIYLAIIVGLIFHAAMYGPQAAFIAELFSTRTRFSGASLAYQFTSIFAGSLAPIIAVWLLREGQSPLAVSLYVAGACLISVFAALKARETAGETFEDIDARHG